MAFDAKPPQGTNDLKELIAGVFRTAIEDMPISDRSKAAHEIDPDSGVILGMYGRDKSWKRQPNKRTFKDESGVKCVYREFKHETLPGTVEVTEVHTIPGNPVIKFGLSSDFPATLVRALERVSADPAKVPPGGKIDRGPSIHDTPKPDGYGEFS